MKVKTRIAYRRVFVIIFLFISLTSCLYSVRAVNEKDPITTIAWLVDGKTTKEEIIHNCSNVNPIGSLTQGKILIYAVNFDQQKSQITCSDKGDYQLILVFDEHDVMERHSILKNQ